MKKVLLSLIVFPALSSVSMGATYMTSAKGNGINVRTSPTTKSRVVKVVPSGDIVNSDERSGNWYKVESVDSESEYNGYIHNSLLKPVTERNVLPNGNTNVRAAGSLKSKVIGKVNSEDVIYTIGNKNKGWYHVRLSKYQANGKKFGYIHESRFQK